MTKRILAAAVVATALSISACGREEENVAIENVEELNATEDLNMDMNMDMNADMNVDMNVDANATVNGADNAAADNTTNSY